VDEGPQDAEVSGFLSRWGPVCGGVRGARTRPDRDDERCTNGVYSVRQGTAASFDGCLTPLHLAEGRAPGPAARRRKSRPLNRSSTFIGWSKVIYRDTLVNGLMEIVCLHEGRGHLKNDLEATSSGSNGLRGGRRCMRPRSAQIGRSRAIDGPDGGSHWTWNLPRSRPPRPSPA
jgi:hypothetical protein